MLEVVISEEAIQDENGIWDFIAFAIPSSCDPEAGFRVLKAFQNTYTTLSEFPHRKKIPRRDLYISPVEGFSQYLVIYQFDDETLTVRRMIRADMDWMQVIQEL